MKIFVAMMSLLLGAAAFVKVLAVTDILDPLGCRYCAIDCGE
jgi:hypothetical protein